MSVLQAPTLVKYFYSILYNQEHISLEKIKEILAEEHDGELFVFTPEFNPLTEYYSKEMGQNLKRVIFYQKQLEERDLLVPRKIWATKVEQKNSKDNKRLVNIDVGYVAKEQVLLATGKPYSHRIYLGEGVFAELVYFFKEKTFKSVPWTYPDYQHEEKVQFFNSVR